MKANTLSITKNSHQRTVLRLSVWQILCRKKKKEEFWMTLWQPKMLRTIGLSKWIPVHYIRKIFNKFSGKAYILCIGLPWCTTKDWKTLIILYILLYTAWSHEWHSFPFISEKIMRRSLHIFSVKINLFPNQSEQYCYQCLWFTDLL